MMGLLFSYITYIIHSCLMGSSKDMRSILSMRFPPISRTALNKLMKGVYTRSRTRGFFKPSEVDRYANLLVDFYVKKKSANMIGLV